jgi:pyruvate ferredoxin oxidoreductase alpha subunit
MLKQIETSRAVAQMVTLCRPEVVCAYPITPQTHIVEGLSELVKTGELAHCEFINVESEFAALSVAIGASAAGARAYTATSSQGLLFMAEAVYNAAGLGLPIVMTIGNRAIGAPINIWNDHSDSMSLRDAGWIQLHAETAQEAADLHVVAFRVAEQLSCPVMVCMDGFVLTHSYEEVNIPSQSEVDKFLPSFEPRQLLDPREPVSIGAMVGPEAFLEVRYLQHHNQLRALELIPEISGSFNQEFGGDSGGLFRKYRTEGADTIVVALGSVNGTIKDVIDGMREDGVSIGCISICCYRPFPFTGLRAELSRARRVLVVDKSLAPGAGGMLASDIRLALAGTKTRVLTTIAGLGGRPITKRSLRDLFSRAERGELDELTFLDLSSETIQRELHSQSQRGSETPQRSAAQEEERRAQCLPSL